MPKLVDEGSKRVPLNCLVLPTTLEYLKSAESSQGVVVDRAIEALKIQEAQSRVIAETGDPWKAVAVNPQVASSPSERAFKREPRQKGDKTR